MNNKCLRTYAGLGAILLAAVSAPCAIEYLPAENIIQITGFPTERPCTPADLLRVDRAFGWNKVTGCATSGVYTLDCGLCIGRNTGASAYFQLGSAAQPDETLIVRGNVRVYPLWLKDENPDWPHHKIRGMKPRNRLTLGVAGQPEIRARLLIDNQSCAGYSLMVGGTSGYGSENYGGDLIVHYGTIAPLGEVRIGDGKPLVPVNMGGHGELVLDHAIIRGVAGQFARNLCAGAVADTRFEDGGIGFAGAYQKELRDCVFAGCRIALTAPTRTPLELRRCVFRDNACNWRITYQPIIAIDCEFDAWDKGAFLNAKPETFFISKRHVVVKVLDAAGKPVRNAQVRASPNVPPRAAEHDVEYAKTNAEGRTPGLDEPGALLLSEVLLTAPEAAGTAPARTDYRYTITARTAKSSGEIVGVAIEGRCAEFTLVLAASGA